MKPGLRRIPDGPTTAPRGERIDPFSSSWAWVDKGSLLGRLFRRRLEERSGRLRFGISVRLGADRDGDSLDLLDCNDSGGQQAKHEVDATGRAAIAIPPTPDAPRIDGEQSGNAMLLEAERIECHAKFGRTCFCVNGHVAP
jgi:hypothetical protein